MNFIIGIFKGCILGATAIIPGISIGTMAIVLNVYEKAIEGFSIVCAPKQWNKHNIREYRNFFVPLLIGLVIAMVLLANVFSLLLIHYPKFLLGGFFGIIVGSLPHIYNAHIRKHLSWATAIYVVLGIVAILFFSFADELFVVQAGSAAIELQVTLRSVLLALFMGAISSACGLIPGFSGSFVLLILGYYAYYLTIIKSLHIILLIPLIIGHLLGFVGIAVGIKYVLTHFPTQSYSIILGLIVGSAIVIFPYGIAKELLSLGSPTKIVGYMLIMLVCISGGILLARLGTIATNSTPSTNPSNNNQ